MRTFLINWALARQNGWQIVLRVDDLDGPRVKQGADQQAIDMLRWIGLDWDEGPYYQTACLDSYRAALWQLAQRGQIYPCRCTRSEIQAAQSAPHIDEHELRYPGICRAAEIRPVPLDRLDDANVAWRIRVPEGVRTFEDQFAGAYDSDLQAEVGDFVVATKQGTASYQLAVVVDDAQPRDRSRCPW